MKLTDEEFREEYHSLHVPAHYEKDGSEHDQVIFTLAELNEASADQVIAEWQRLQGHQADEQQKVYVKTVLAGLFDKGLLGGAEKNGTMFYNLHKITRANGGETDPDLLEPGLD